MTAEQQLPTWNKSVLDAAVKRALQKADGSRPVVPHSGVTPHLPQLDGTDQHLYFGWYMGDERDLPAFARRLPRMVRFVSEFGAQAVPSGDAAGFAHPERWPDLDWDELELRHALQKPVFDRHVPPDGYATFAGWRDATQRYQAQVIRRHGRGAAAAEVPPDRRVRPVPVRRRPAGRHLVGARPRAWTQARPRGAARRRAGR